MDFELFLDHLQGQKHCTPATVVAYRSDLKFFAHFIQELGLHRLNQVTHSVIGKYIAHMREVENPRFDRKGLSDSTISRRLAAVSSFFDYTRATTNPKLRNPLDDLVQRWQHNDEPKPVDDLTIDRLLDGITVERDRVLIELFVVTGLRVSEMHSLDRDTIKFELEVDDAGERVTGVGQVLGKGRKRRRFFVDERTLDRYAQYLANRTDNNPALFLSERKKRMSVGAIQYTLRTWCQRLGIAHINVHRLRHTYATNLANAHIDSIVLRDLMGHNNGATTAKYFKLTDTTIARGYHSAMEYRRQ